MRTTRTVKGTQVVITDDIGVRNLEVSQGSVVYLTSEIEAAKSQALFKPLSEWLFDMKTILPATQLLAVRVVNQA